MLKLDIGYAYLWAMIPLKFDNPTRTFVLSKSKAHSISYSITMDLLVLEKCFVLAFLVRDILNDKFGLKDKFEILRMGFTSVSMYCVMECVIPTIFGRAPRSPRK
jgi:hypothetical protein